VLAFSRPRGQLHGWDITVALDAAMADAADAATLVIDNLGGMVDRVGTGTPQPTTVHVITSNPDRQFLLELVTQSVRLAPA
jgi:hypothetical protein